MTSEEEDELKVTFHPQLYLQRQIWILDTLRREGVESVLDIGCGEGSLLKCLVQPSWTLPPTTSLPATSPFVCGPCAEYHADLHLKALHGLDPYAPDLELAIRGTAPPEPDELPFTGYERWRRREARWMTLEVNLWEGGFEAINESLEGSKIDAFVASEVIEHLSPELLPLFAPILLGHYRPRLLLLTTPNYTYNERFTPPGEIDPMGYPDPTMRTDRIFRHHDHKFEWTTEEWTKYCTEAAAVFGYTVHIGGVGLAVEPDPWNREAKLGFASQFVTFRRIDEEKPPSSSLDYLFKNDYPVSTQQHVLRARQLHLPHPLSLEELAQPPVPHEIRQAVGAVMNDNREGTMTFAELWKTGEISLKCAGDIGALVRAFGSEDLDNEEWALIDEDRGWEASIVWKSFNYAPPAKLDLLPNTHDWPEDNISCEDASDDLEPVDLTPVDEVIPSNAEEVANAWGQECSWDGEEGDRWGDAAGTDGWNPREETFWSSSLEHCTVSTG